MSRRTLLLHWGVRDSLRSAWFVGNAVAFLAGGTLLMLFGGGDAALLGYRGFARAIAALVQLALFLVPLMAIFPATASIAGESEVGSLDYLLAQPLTRDEVFAGKWGGVAAALVLSLLLAFGATGWVAASRGVPVPLLLGLLSLTLLLAIAFTSLGLWISAASSSRSRATTYGLLLWLTLVALGSLGLMATFVRWGWPPEVLEAWALANPVEAFRLAAVTLLDPGSDLLGPVGAALIERLGEKGILLAAGTSLALWSLAGYRLGRRALRKR